MAEYDGSIRIDTSLDDTGFEKGSKKMNEAMQSAANSAEQAGDKIRNSFSESFKISFDNISGASEIDGLSEKAEKLSLAIERAELKLEKAKTALDAYKSSKIPTEEYKAVTSELEKAEKKYISLLDKQETLSRLKVSESSTQWKRLQIDLQNTEKRLEELEEMEETLRNSGDDLVNPETTIGFKELQLSVKEAEQQLQGLYRTAASTANGAGTDGILQAKSDADDYSASLASANEELEEMELQHVTPPAPDANVSEKWQYYKSVVKNTFQEMKQNIDSAVAKGYEAGGMFGAFAYGIGRLTFEVGKLALSIAKLTVQGAWTVLKKAGSVILPALKKAATKAASGIKALASHINIFKRGSSGATLSSNKLVRSLLSLKTMLIGRLKRTFISKITEQISNGIKALAQFDSSFDKSVSNMMNRSTELGANISVSIGMLTKQFEPAITRILQTATNAMTKVNAIFAYLRGDNSVTVAKKQTASYAESLNESANSAKEAEKAQKKLNSSLSSYDEIHRLDDISDTTTDTSTETNATDLYETVPVSTILSRMPNYGQEIVRRVKQSIKSGDWRGAGLAVADGFNYIVQQIRTKIDEVRPLVEQWAINLADGLSGITGRLDGYQIGDTIASVLNLAFGTVDAFITNYDWDALGVLIGNGFNGLFLETDFALIGKTLGDGANAAFNVVYKSVTTFKWAEAGANFALGINSLFHTVDWGKVGRTLSDAFKGVLSFINTALEETDWGAVAESIQESLVNIDWAGIISGLFSAIGLLIGGLGSILYDLVIVPLQEYFEKEFESMDTGNIGLDIILGILKGIGDALIGIGTWIKDNIFVPFVEGIKKAFGIASPSKEMAEQGTFISEGLLQGIKKAWKAIPKWLKEKAEGIKSDLSKKWESLKTTTNQKWSEIKGKIETNMTAAKQNSIKLASTLIGKVKDKWDNLHEDTSIGFQNIKNAATGKFTDLWNELAGFDFTYIGSNLMSGISNGIHSGWETVKGGISKIWAKITGSAEDEYEIHSPSKVFAKIGEFLIRGLSLGIENGKNEALNTVSDIANGITDRMNTEIPYLELQEGNIVSHLNQVADKLTSIARAFQAINSMMPSIGGFAMPAIASGTVVPARVKVSDTISTKSDQSKDVYALLSKIIELLDGKDTDTNPNDGRALSVNIPVTINKREIGRAIADIDIRNGRVTNSGGKR